MLKVAILIDGGFFLKRLPSFGFDADRHGPERVDRAIGLLVSNHLETLLIEHGGQSPDALLYRCFYYDAKPYVAKAHFPVSKEAIDYAKSDEARFRLALFELLRRRPNFAVRLGHVDKVRSWTLKEDSQKELLGGRKEFKDLTDDDFAPGFRQKAVDMRLGLDVASITLKRQANTIILVTGDSDFVPAAKLARREGVRIILDPLWQTVKPELYEHIDVLRSGLDRPGKRRQDSETGNE
jgi:uncharacterized LabA/DUF88 family protein